MLFRSPVGALQEHLGIPASTLSHHLAHLVNVGLVRQERDGRQLLCRPDFELMTAVTDFLTEQCCTGVAPAVEKRRTG